MLSTSVGSFIRETRLSKNMTLADVATKAGISSPVLSKIETGLTQHPNKDTLVNIAFALNVDKDVLLARAGYVSDDWSEEVINQIYHSYINEAAATDTNKYVSVSKMSYIQNKIIDKYPMVDMIREVVELYGPAYLTGSQKNEIANEMVALYEIRLKKLKWIRGDYPKKGG